MVRNSAAGSAASAKRTSEVIDEPAAMITYLLLRVRPTPIQNRSSGSWNTCSSGCPEPSLCRHTVSGRHASSTVV